jgi:hypothetical protein
MPDTYSLFGDRAGNLWMERIISSTATRHRNLTRITVSITSADPNSSSIVTHIALSARRNPR